MRFVGSNLNCVISRSNPEKQAEWQRSVFCHRISTKHNDVPVLNSNCSCRGDKQSIDSSSHFLLVLSPALELKKNVFFLIIELDSQLDETLLLV